MMTSSTVLHNDDDAASPWQKVVAMIAFMKAITLHAGKAAKCFGPVGTCICEFAPCGLRGCKNGAHSIS